MRILILAVVALLLGVSVGGGVSWYEFARGENHFAASGLTDAQRWPVPAGHNKRLLNERLDALKQSAGGKAYVDNGETYDFGTMDVDTTEKHTFIIRNVGRQPLTISQGRTTCKCTTSELPNDEIAPNKTAEVTLEWTAKEYDDNFEQTAEIITSDPERDILHLKVMGRVVPLIRAAPSSVVFSDLSLSESRLAEVKIAAFKHEELKYESHEFTNPETADFFSVRFRQMKESFASAEFDALSGLIALVAVKPGLPVGPINQTLRVKTNVHTVKGLDIPIRGEVVGDITFRGHPNLDARKSVLDLKMVPIDKGRKVMTHVIVQGPHRDELELSVGEVTPADVLQASLGEPVTISSGKAKMYPLTIVIPPDSRPTTLLGPSADNLGIVRIQSTHPRTKEIRLYIRFAIGG